MEHLCLHVLVKQSYAMGIGMQVLMELQIATHKNQNNLLEDLLIQII